MPENFPTPLPENQPAETERQIMQKRVKATWDLFKDTEKDLIAKGSDLDFQKACHSLDGATCRKWLSFRRLIRTGDPLASLIIEELEVSMPVAEVAPPKNGKEEKPIKEISENPLANLSFAESDDKKFFYNVLRDKYTYDNGLTAARTKFKIDVRYPTEEQALVLLNKLKADFPEKAVAAFIDEDNAFVFLSKTGKSGKFKSDRVPGDTELFVIVVAYQK